MDVPLVKIKGLHTFPSPISEVPEGALLVADDIIIDRESIAEPRRGFGYLTHGSGNQSNFSDLTYRANKLFFYQNQILCHYSSASLAYHDSTSGWVNLSTSFSPPSSTVPVRFAQANKNMYLTSSVGVQKLDSYTSVPVAVGMPQALDLQASIAVAVTPTATTTSTSKVLTALSSVTGIGIGMSAAGTNIPANSYVVSFNGTTVTLNNAASGSGSGITITFGIPSSWLAPAGSTAAGLNTTAYRMVWSRLDANQNLIIGAPSQISQVANTTASNASPIVNFTIPSGATTSWIYGIYRSPAVVNSSTPNDEGQLVYQGSPVAADITYGTISVLDIVPESLFGAKIYTAASQQGLTQQNTPAPFAYDLAVYKNSLFYGNVSGLQTYTLTLLGTGTPAGIQAADTLTIAGVVFTAAAAEVISTGTFAVAAVIALAITGNITSTSATVTTLSATTSIAAGQSISGAGIPPGTYVISVNTGASTLVMSQAATATTSTVPLTITGDSAAQAIRDTALSLVRVINRYASSTLFAYYLSGPADLPGQILIQSRTVGAAVFNVTSSRPTCWNPILPSSGTTQASTNLAARNRVFFSKTSQPEHVPSVNYLDIGSGDQDILRVIALRDSLFILKNDGIFYVTGSDPSNFAVWPLDYTTNIVGPETAVALNNQIFAMSTQGVVAITQNGVSIMSHDIETDLTGLIAKNYAYLQNTSFAVAYESQRTYYLFCVTNAGDTLPTQYYRFNYITQSWTHSVMSKRCGGVNPLDDKMYLGNASLNIIDVENKNLSYTDYSDYLSTQTISAVAGTLVTITETDTISIGAIIFQSSSIFGVVISVDPIAGTVTTSLPSGLVAGSADVLAPISGTMQWAPFVLGDAGANKQFREVAILFKSDFNGSGYVDFASDWYPAIGTETITGSGIGGWGQFPWGGPSDTPGGVVWGGDPRKRPIRVTVPRNYQRCTELFVSFRHAYGYSPWQIQGIYIIGDKISERTGN